MAISIEIARFAQFWLNWDTSAYFILFMAMKRNFGHFLISRGGALKLILTLIQILISPQNPPNLVHISNKDTKCKIRN